MAGEGIPRERLSIHRPAPPPGLGEAIEYGADHLLLRASGSAAASGADGTALRVDAELFRTLSAVQDGLPRRLINPGELNRLDAFLDRLRCLEPFAARGVSHLQRRAGGVERGEAVGGIGSVRRHRTVERGATRMNKRQAHQEAFGYEPTRMKPAHFASGFFLSLTDRTYANERLNKVAVTKTNRGLLEDYTPEAVVEGLQEEELVGSAMTQAKVELLRMQVNGIVNNDAAMYPAFPPYRPKGNDYTFFSPRMLTRENRTDGYAGHFVALVLGESESGRRVLEFGRSLAEETAGTLERFIEPLLKGEEAEEWGLADRYESQLGRVDVARLEEIATATCAQTKALARLCGNLVDYSHYRRVRYFVLGLLAWLMSHVLRTASVLAAEPLLLFDFVGDRAGPIRSQSRTCYARLRETVRGAYVDLAGAGRFSEDPVAGRVFARKNREEENDFRFLEQHFGDLALRMGYAQPRASRVPQKHFEFQPDTLRTLMLSILDHDAANAIRFDEVCEELRATWGVVAGGGEGESEVLRGHGYFGFDESDLRRNAVAFAGRLAELNLAVEPSDGLVLCSRDVGEVL